MIETLRGKRILICEEALVDYKGHFYSWIKAIRALHLEAGVEVLVACNKNVKEEIRREFDAFPVYTHNNWSGIYDYKQAWKRHLSVFKHNYYVWKETRKLLKKTGPVDCILLTAARIHQVMAWRMLCRNALGRDFKRLVMFILTSEAVYDKSFTRFHFKKTSLLMKSVLKSYKKYIAAGKVIMAGDSHITANEYETLSGVPFRVFPSPAAGLEAVRDPDGLKLSRDKDLTTFVTLGVSFIDKGIDVLQHAILLLLEEDPLLPARFIIQWSQQMTGYDGTIILISDQLRNAPQVEIIEHTLDETSYKQYLHRADFVMLPYRLKVYFNRISGVAVEAACAGIPMIVTKNSWLEWALNKFGAGVTVEDGNFRDLAEKIKYCIINKEQYLWEAGESKIRAIKENSTNHYLEIMWK